MSEASSAVECASWCHQSDARTGAHGPDSRACTSESRIVLLSQSQLPGVDGELRVPDHLTGVLRREAGVSEPHIIVSHNDTTTFSLSLEDAVRLAARLRTLANEASA
jgi:hypothetical protein